jgi:hypothetical protein
MQTLGSLQGSAREIWTFGASGMLIRRRKDFSLFCLHALIETAYPRKA